VTHSDPKFEKKRTLTFYDSIGLTNNTKNKFLCRFAKSFSFSFCSAKPRA
jgi:hypothetical protein